MGIRTCDTCGATFAGSMCPQCAVTKVRPAAPPIVPGPGVHFHGLEVLDILGRGGMGVVYRARQASLDRFVALKILPPDRATEADFEARFEREAKALASLNHPNIVTIHDFGKEAGLYFLVMEYVEGPTLRAHLGGAPAGAEEAVRILDSLCDALEFAHRKGIVHRDIKPENVLLGAEGRIKLADFGLARLVDRPEARLTETNVVVGTAHYMAPEQLLNPKGVDHRADIYALGALLYELTTGRPPMGSFEMPSRIAGADVRLDAIIRKALANDPAARHQSVSELRVEIRRATSQLATVIAPRTRRPLPWKPVLFALLVLAGLSILYVGLQRHPRALGLISPPTRPARRSFKELRAIDAHSGGVKSVVWSGKMLASCGFESVKFWDLDGRDLGHFEIHKNWINDLACAPDGGVLVTAGTDRTAVLWDMVERKVRYELFGHTEPVNGCAFSPDGKIVATASTDRSVILWDTATGHSLRTLQAPTGVQKVTFSPDGSMLATAYRDGRVALWQVAEGISVRTFVGHEGIALAVAFRPDGKVIATGGADKTVRLWDAADGRTLSKWTGHAGNVLDLAWSADGGTLASGGLDKKILLWSADGSFVELTGHTGAVSSIVWVNPTTLVSGGVDGAIRIWSAAE